MTTIDDIFKDIADESAQAVKEEFTQLFTQAKAESEELVKENAEKVKEWLAALVLKQLDKDGIGQLFAAQQRKIVQFLNTQQIEERARLEKITLKIIDIALNKIVPLILHV